MSNAYIKSGSVITVHVNGKMLTVTEAHVNYNPIELELKKPLPNWETIEGWADVAGTVEEWAQGLFKVVGGVLHMGGKEVHSALLHPLPTLPLTSSVTPPKLL
jgi:hypothetical protein